MFDNQKTKEILASMLTENTGIAMLDSGGVYGRNWQENAGKTVADFEAAPRSTFKANWGLTFTHDLFHWLESRLIYSESLDKLFQEYAELESNSDESWFVIKESFPVWLEREHGVYTGGIYGEDDPFIVNTYNGEDMLSQVIQYLYFEVTDAGDSEIEETAYIALMIHGGCDVRGGYTMPRIFEVAGNSVSDGTDILHNADGSVFCNHCGCYWDTQDAGFSFPEKGSHELEYTEWDVLPDLEKLTLIGDSKERDDVLTWYLDQIWKLDHKLDFAKIARVYGDENTLYALPSGDVVCPHCGEGILQGDFN